MFAGIGGFRTGLTNAGDFFMPVGWCEKDKHAQKAYRLLYGTEGEYFCDDARIINPADLPDFDLICGGFPCQPFSVAGQRLGFADERGTLFHEICRLAEARHPKYLLLENVSGLLTHEGGKTFLAILTALTSKRKITTKKWASQKRIMSDCGMHSCGFRAGFCSPTMTARKSVSCIRGTAS